LLKAAWFFQQGVGEDLRRLNEFIVNGLRPSRARSWRICSADASPQRS